MTSRIGRRLAKHKVQFFEDDSPAASPSVSEDGGAAVSFSDEGGAHGRKVSFAQDSGSGSGGGLSTRTKLAILVVAAGLASGVVWHKTKDSSPEYAKQYALMAAGGVVGILIYLLFIKRIL